MAFLLVTLLVVLYSFQSLFLKLFSAKYPAEKSALASTVFNISYGAFAGITTLCAMGFRFSASKVTLICGLVNAVTLLCYTVSMIPAILKGSYAFQMIAMLFGGIVVPMLHSVIFLGDRLSLLQCLAVALMLVSFVLMNLQGLSLKGSGKSFLLWCLALFFSNGMIVLTYLGMAVLCALFQGAKDAKGLARGFKMPARPLIFLLACCLCATLASHLLLYVLTLVDTTVLYTIDNGGVLALSVLYSCVLFREKLNRYQIAGIALSLASIIMLSV